MAATSSTMLALGTEPAEFHLPDVATGRLVSLENVAGAKALLVVFLCAHCPYVHHVAAELARLRRDYRPEELAIVGITSNDIDGYPQDAPEPTAHFAREQGWEFPVLHDATQEVAQAYSAACTPDFFLFGPGRTLVYRGQLDGTRPGNGTADGGDLRAAIEAVRTGAPVTEEQRPSIGCNIKWKSGNEPGDFRK